MDRENVVVSTPSRARARWLRRCALAGLVCGIAPTAMAERTITGEIRYGTIRNDIGEAAPPTNLIVSNMPVQRVKVELIEFTPEGVQTVPGSSDITDVNGRYRITFPGTPIVMLRTKAENDYVTVKKFMGTFQNLEIDDPLDTYRQISLDYNTCLDGDTCEMDPVTVVSDVTDSFHSINGTYTNYISRAFYLAGAAHASGTNVESVHGANLPGEKVAVRMGINPAINSGWYWQVPNTIFIPNTGTVTFWHEYGHFVEDKIGAFALVPPYSSHNECVPITDGGVGNTNPNLCWSYLEGLATWLAALNAAPFYGGYDPMVAAFDGDGNVCTRDGRNDVERNQCDSVDDQDLDGDGDCTEVLTPAIFSEPRAVESIVSNVLWDLLDDVQDPANSTGVDEVATATAQEILAVVTAPMSPHVSCGFGELNSHPMGLDEFWDEWKRQHPDRMADIFAAYAFNGADLGNADDVSPPGPVLLDSSPEPGVWSNDNSVTLTVTDGVDDISGSYAYFVVADLSPQTSVATTGVPTFTSKEKVQATVVDLPDGDDQYIHVNTLDMKGHPGTATTHLGRLRIDTVDPYLTAPLKVIPFRIDPTVPATDPTLVLGYPALITWASDDDLSGVAEVRLTFVDTATGFWKDIRTTPVKAGSYSWFVDDVPAASGGQLMITVTDQAGNDVVRAVPAPVKTPFSGPLAVSLGADSDPCHDGRVVSGDLQRDGFDDIVLVCRFNASGHLYVFSGSGNGLTRTQDFPWSAADDLVAADLDGDGDLDVVTVSLAAPGVATEAEILYNDGTGTLVDPGIARPLGALDRKTVRVIHPYDRKAPVIAVFGELQPGNVPGLVAFGAAPGYPLVALPGVSPVVGDWEAADMNGDGYVDLVALGDDGLGTQALSVFSGSSGAFSRQDIETYTSATGADVDLGDFDADGKPDIFVMFEDTGLTRVTKLLRRGTASFTTFASAGSASRQVAGGDGFIVDTANDARSEVLAMGRTATDEISGWYLRNDSIVGTLQETAIEAMLPLAETDTAWGDFDGDGDLDVFQIGSNGTEFTFARYENRLGTYIDQNDAPKQPVNLTSSAYDPVRGGYTFSWSAAVPTNDETPPAGFGYELRVGTTQNGGQILSWAHPAGPSQQGFRLDRFLRLPAGAYWYSVRTVDSGWMRSAPAPTKRTTP